VLISFDLIELDGHDLRRERIEHRKPRPAKLVRGPHPGIALHKHYEDDGEVVFQDACKLGWYPVAPPIARDARCIG
jgi:ATP-dependent DNA ligase